jgi:hypothetical protein
MACRKTSNRGQLALRSFGVQEPSEGGGVVFSGIAVLCYSAGEQQMNAVGDVDAWWLDTRRVNIYMRLRPP